MTTVTESDLKELKDLIIAFREETNSRFTAIENRLTNVENNLSSVENRLTVIETRLDEWRPSISKIPDLAEKVGELKNWKQIGLVFVTAVVSSIFSGTIGKDTDCRLVGNRKVSVGVIGWLIRSGKV